MSTQSIDLYRLQIFKQIVSERNNESVKRCTVALADDAQRLLDYVLKGRRTGWQLYEKIFFMQQNLERLRREVFECGLSEEEALKVAGLIWEATEQAKAKARKPRRQKVA